MGMPLISIGGAGERKFPGFEVRPIWVQLLALALQSYTAWVCLPFRKNWGNTCILPESTWECLAHNMMLDSPSQNKRYTEQRKRGYFLLKMFMFLYTTESHFNESGHSFESGCWNSPLFQLQQLVGTASSLRGSLTWLWPVKPLNTYICLLVTAKL